MKQFLKTMLKVYQFAGLFILGDVVGTAGIGALFDQLLDYVPDPTPALESLCVALAPEQSADAVMDAIEANMPPAIKIHDMYVDGGEVVVDVAEGKGDWAQQYLPVAYDGETEPAAGPLLTAGYGSGDGDVTEPYLPVAYDENTDPAAGPLFTA